MNVSNIHFMDYTDTLITIVNNQGPGGLNTSLGPGQMVWLYRYNLHSLVHQCKSHRETVEIDKQLIWGSCSQ